MIGVFTAKTKNPFGVSRPLFSLIVALVLIAPVAPAMAGQLAEDREVVDGRLEGLTNDGEHVTEVTMDKSGTGAYWMLFVVLAMVMSAGLFKNAQRSHLD